MVNEKDRNVKGCSFGQVTRERVDNFIEMFNDFKENDFRHLAEKVEQIAKTFLGGVGNNLDFIFNGSWISCKSNYFRRVNVSEKSNKVKWIIVGSIIGTIIGAAISPLITTFFKNIYTKMGLKIGAPKKKLPRRY